MIDLPAAQPPAAPPAVATIAAGPIAFAPPLGMPIAYRLVRTDPATGGVARIETAERLTVTRRDAGYLATVVIEAATIDAAPRLKAALEALYAPLVGVSARLALAADGTAGAVVDPQASAAAVRRATQALLARIEADATIPADVKAMERAALAREATPAGIEARLRDTADDLLVPPLPPLRVGETRAFATDLATPAGTVPATGRVTRAADSAGDARIDLVVEGAAEAGIAAAARLRATAATLSGTARARLEAIAAAMTAGRYVERTTIRVDPKTGLLNGMTIVRATVAADGSERSLGTREVTRR